MSFRFRLQRVLELREQHEQACARALALAESAAEAAQRAKEEMEALKEASRSEIAAAHGYSPRVGHLRQLGLTIDALEHRVEQATQAVATARENVESARHALEGAGRDRRVLERLKEKHSAEHHTEALAKDRVGMDEVALSLFARNKHRAGMHTDTVTSADESSEKRLSGGRS